MADGPDEAPTDGTPDAPPVETTTGAAPSERARDPLLLALIGLAVAVLLFLAAAIPVLRDRDGGTDESVTASGSTTSVADEAVTSAPDPTAPDEPAGGATTTTVSAADEPATSVSNGVPDSTPATIAPDDATTPTGATGTAAGATTTTNPQRTGTAGGDDVPESIAVVQGGKIYLSGAVPDQESMIRIVALAGEVLGPENVINDYFIDPRASDPNLGNVRVDDNILFESGTATIAREFEPLLNQALVLMTIRPSVTMHVVGHTDDRGSVEDNQDLSERRAEAVVRWLTDRGIDPARLTSEGRGELEPVATNDTEAGRALNRRIQVFIANLLSADVVEDALSNG